MQALILAAGKGTRLQCANHKALLKINSQPIICRLIEQMFSLGVSEIAVVTGYQRHELEKALAKYQVKFVFNPFYEISDNLVSFWFGAQQIESDCIITHCDIIMDESLLKEIINTPEEIVLPYDTTSLDMESMKIQLYEGKIEALSKELSLEQATGESIPLMKFSLKAFQALKIIADRYLARKKFRTLMESVISELIKKESLSVNALNVSGLKWCEIDTPADWEKARRLF